MDLHPSKALFSLDPDNLQLHCFLGLGALFCCSFLCPLDQPCKMLQTMQVASGGVIKFGACVYFFAILVSAKKKKKKKKKGWYYIRGLCFILMKIKSTWIKLNGQPNTCMTTQDNHIVLCVLYESIWQLLSSWFPVFALNPYTIHFQLAPAVHLQSAVNVVLFFN